MKFSERSLYMTEENKKARKEKIQKIKRTKFHKSIDNRKEYFISYGLELVLLFCTSIFSSSQLSTLILSFAFDFVFINYFYNSFKVSRVERIQKDIYEYNKKIKAKPRRTSQNKPQTAPNNKFISFDENYFERRSKLTINTFRLFIYCTSVIPSLIYESLTKKDISFDLALMFLALGAIPFISIFIISPEVTTIGKMYTTKYNLFKDIRDSFEKEDFLYLNKSDSSIPNENNK